MPSEPSFRHRSWSRRWFIGSAASGLGWAAIPASAWGIEPIVGASVLSIRFRRSLDHVDFLIRSTHLELVWKGVVCPSLCLRPKRGVKNALVSLILEPQHLLEQAIPEESTGSNLIARGTLAAWAANQTRLVFKWPSPDLEVPLTDEGVLGIFGFDGVFPGKGIAIPREEESWIEPIAGIVVTPASPARWRSRHGRSAKRPLWTVELRPVLGPLEVWLVHSTTKSDVPCFNHNGSTIVCPVSLTSNQRRELVRTFSGDAPVCNPSATLPVPPTASLFELSGQGSFVDVSAAWNPPAACALESWKHTVTHGRDHFVEYVEKWWTYPDGIPVTLVYETKRHFERGSLSGSGAFLKKRIMARATESSVLAEISPELPFKKVQIPLQELPPLDLDDINPNEPDQAGYVIYENNEVCAFWPLVGGRPLAMDVECTDHQGRVRTLRRRFLLVKNTLVEPLTGTLTTAHLDLLDTAWDTDLQARREVQVDERLAIYPERNAGDTTIEVNRIDFARAANPSLRAPLTRPFLPRAHVIVATPDVGRLLSGSAARLSLTYRQSDPGTPASARSISAPPILDPLTSAAEAFVSALPSAGDKLIATPSAVARLGGLTQPSTKVAGIGREKGLIPGPIGTVVSPPTNLGDLFPDGAKLLGAFSLKDILGAVTSAIKEGPSWSFLAAEEEKQVDLPKEILQELIGYQLPAHADPLIETFGWNAALDWETEAFQTVALFKPRTGCKLSVKASISANPIAGTMAWESRAELANFTVAFPDANAFWFAVDFDNVSFGGSSSSTMGFDVKVGGFRLGPPLDLLNQLGSLLGNATSGLTVGVIDSGIRVAQAIHLKGPMDLGPCTLSGLSISAALTLPLQGAPLRTTFALNDRANPFIVSVQGYAGGGFLEIGASTEGVHLLAFAAEFGGFASREFGGVAKGEARLMAGIYFRLENQVTYLEGYARLRGFLDVAGIGGVDVGAYFGLSYSGGEACGKCRVSFSTRIGPLEFTQAFDVRECYGSRRMSASRASTSADGPDWESFCEQYA